MSAFHATIKAIKDAGGVATSDHLRAVTGLTEIPARISDANSAGYEINSRRIDDWSHGYRRQIAEYALIHEPQAVSHAS